MSIYITSVGNRLTESMLAASRPDRFVNRPCCSIAIYHAICANTMNAEPMENYEIGYFE